MQNDGCRHQGHDSPNDEEKNLEQKVLAGETDEIQEISAINRHGRASQGWGEQEGQILQLVDRIALCLCRDDRQQAEKKQDGTYVHWRR